jgi:hypothetical protein
MKYKIQMVNALGKWGDMKTSENGEKYETELFDSRQQAKDEINDMCEELAEGTSSYRVVREDKQQDVDYYN